MGQPEEPAGADWGEPTPAGAGFGATPQRRRSGRLPATDLPDGSGPIVDLGIGGPLSRRRGARDAATVRSGAAALRPIVVFCHIRGERDPFPPRWRWGQMTIGQGAPSWRAVGRGGATLVLPAGTVQAEAVRPVLRSELSMFSPNPRKSLVVPLDSPAGRILVGVARENAETIVAAITRLRSSEGY